MAIGQENQSEPGRSMPSRASSVMGHLRKIRVHMPSPFILVVTAIIVWVLIGFYTVGSDETGVVTRWGRFVYESEPGLHYHLPYPIESAATPKTSQVRKLAIGAPADDSTEEGAKPAGTLLLTADGSLVQVGFTVLYQINDAQKYLFMVDEPDEALRAAALAVMSEAVGKSGMDQVLTSGKQAIQEEAAGSLQAIMDKYQAGIKVLAVQLQAVNPPGQVQPAFEALVSAKEQKDKLINQAQSVADDLVYEAQGETARIQAQAEAYREEKIKLAQGEAARFVSLLAEYQKASDVTKRRMYLEAMEEVLSRAGRIILEPQKGNLLPLLNLPAPGNQPAPAANRPQ